MAKEVRIHLTAEQKARLDAARGKVSSETADSNREKARQEDSSVALGPNATGLRKARPTVFTRFP